jgi:hypothetical protein
MKRLLIMEVVTVARVTVAPFSMFSLFQSGLRFCQLKQIFC